MPIGGDPALPVLEELRDSVVSVWGRVAPETELGEEGDAAGVWEVWGSTSFTQPLLWSTGPRLDLGQRRWG